MIKYVVPWYKSNLVIENSVDMIISQAVMEHVDNLEEIYKILFKLLKIDGIISMQIDFKSHGTSNFWYGHWKYSNFEWRLLKGKRPYLINRVPFSKHIDLIEKAGFKIIFIKKKIENNKIERKFLDKNFKFLSEEDMKISGAYILAIKKKINFINNLKIKI